MSDKGADRGAASQGPYSFGYGDPACWLDKVCPGCGFYVEDERVGVCPRCGNPLPDAQ